MLVDSVVDRLIEVVNDGACPLGAAIGSDTFVEFKHRLP
jgi:hypothetical protein